MQKSNEELAAMVASGDTAAAAQLWEQVRRLIESESKRFILRNGGYIDKPRTNAPETESKIVGSVSGVAFDDLVQAGYFAMLKAARDFDPSKGYKFTTYLTYRNQTERADICGYHGNMAMRPLNNCISLDRQLSEDDDGSATLGDIIPDERPTTAEIVEDQLQYDQLQQACKNVLDKLPPEEAEAIRQRFYEQRTYQDIANESGEPYHVCRDRVNRAIRRIRQTPRLCNPLQAIMLERQVDELTNFYSTGTGAWFNHQERGVELIAERREYIRRHRAECLAQLDADREYRRQQLQKQLEETRRSLQGYSDSTVSQITILK